jgi:hypothetical protein
VVPNSRASLGPRAYRVLNAPAPILVDADAAGRPRTVRRPGRQRARGVGRVRDRWRVDDEWWRERPIARLYYALLLDDGTFLTVYHDLLEDTWFEQRDPAGDPVR